MDDSKVIGGRMTTTAEFLPTLVLGQREQGVQLSGQ